MQDRAHDRVQSQRHKEPLGHHRHLCNIRFRKRWSHNDVCHHWDVKCGIPQQHIEELATPGGCRRWLTSLGLAAGTCPAHGSRDFEFRH